MYNIQKLNSISPVYHGILPDTEYNVAYEMENPDAIMVRSAGMHDMEINENLLCVGRAGAGVNNIPLDKMAEHGVVVFNSPGANANAVKELVLAGRPAAGQPQDRGWHRVVQGPDSRRADH